MSRKMIFVHLFFIWLIPLNIYAQEPLPILKDVLVESKVEFDANTKLYTYSYFISNPATNTGQIWSVEIDISRSPESRELRVEGLIINKGVSRKGRTLTSSFKEELTSYGSRMRTLIVPIGIQPPSGWSSGFSVMGTASWGSGEKKYRVLPGQSLKGFMITSRGIPTLREIKVEPKWVLVVEDASDEDVERSKQIKKEIAFYTKTLGPTAPPAELNPVAFINGIISMKHEAYTLGWITEKGIEISLDQKLDNAKKQLERGNNNAAKNILNAFINEVEAQGCESYETTCPPGKHLKPEAYALLKYNAQYLADNLR